MSSILSRFGARIGQIPQKTSYWAVKLDSGKWLCELDQRTDIRHAHKRPFDWSLDMVDTGDIKRIKELWLFCPATPNSPRGQSCYLGISEPGTAFQMKVGQVDTFGAWRRQRVAQVIGRVSDKESGACECFIWDQSQARLLRFQSSVYDFGTWSASIAPLGALALPVLGLNLS